MFDQTDGALLILGGFGVLMGLLTIAEWISDIIATRRHRRLMSSWIRHQPAASHTRPWGKRG